MAPSVGADGEPATVGSYPPYHKLAAVTVLGRSPPPPPPPTALVGKHVTVQGSGLPGIEGESGHVTEYDPFNERYHVLLNNGHVYHLAPRHLLLTQAPAKAEQRPPMQKHPLHATVTPSYKPPPVCFDRPKPAGDQPELGPKPPAPHPVRSTLEAGGTPSAPAGPPGPVPTEPSVKEGPPPKTPPPKILCGEPQVPVQRPIQKGHGYQKASVPRPPPAKRTTLHYSLDPAHPGPIAKPAAVDPWMLPAAAPKPAEPAPPKPPPPPTIVKPCAFNDYRKTPPTSASQAAAAPGHPLRALLVARARGFRDRRTVNPRLVDGFRVRGVLAPLRHRSRSPRLEKRLPPQTRRPIRRRRLPRPRQRRNMNLPIRAEHKLPSRGTLRNCRGESGVIAGTPVGSTLILRGERPHDDLRPSTPTRPPCAYWTCGTGTDT